MSGKAVLRIASKQRTFYSKKVVPHNFGFQKMSSFIIDDDDKLKKKLELVESLQNVKTTMDVLKKADGSVLFSSVSC